MKRLVVLGSSGAGKTTVALRLAEILGYPCLELDSVFHRDGWVDVAPGEFLPTVMEFINRNEHWIVDGNYTSQGLIDGLWPAADAIVWVDPPRSVVMHRVVTRTLRRIIRRETLWNELREPASSLYSLDPLRNIIVWAWTRYRDVRSSYEARLDDGSWDHAQVHRLRDASDLDRLLDEASDHARNS